MKAWLVSFGVFSIGLVGCQTVANKTYCDAVTPCGGAQQCVTNKCVGSNAMLDLLGSDGAMDLPVNPDPDLLGPDLLNAPDLKPECTSSAECTTASKPVCGAGGVCRACQDATDDTVCGAKSATRCITTGTNAGQCGACNPDTTAKLKENADCVAALATTPVCTEAGACAACTGHTQCASLVCNFTTGACTPQGDVAYVDNAPGCQTAVHDSTPPNAPYCEIHQAVLDSRSIIHVAGSATPYGRLAFSSLGKNVLIVGPGGTATTTARVFEQDETSIFVGITNDATQSYSVTVDGLELGGTDSSKSDRGLSCNDDNGSDAESVTVRIVRSKINYNSDSGIDAHDCILQVESSIVSNNTKAGVKSDGKALTITTTNVFANGEVGIHSNDNSPYSITNNFLRGNGTVAGFPGVLLSGNSAGTFSFNTVTANGGALDIEGGVQCSTGGIEKRNIEYSIVSGNSKKSGTQFKDNCDLVQVVVGTDATADTDAIKDKPPSFLSATDLHLGAVAANSDCCIDKVAANVCVAKDIDGQPRPSGALCDIGADEVTP